MARIAPMQHRPTFPNKVLQRKPNLPTILPASLGVNSPLLKDGVYDEVEVADSSLACLHHEASFALQIRRVENYLQNLCD